MKIFIDLKKVVSALWIQLQYVMRLERAYESQIEKYPDTTSARMSDDMHLKFKGSIRNDLSKCSGCGACVPACPVGAIEIDAESLNDGSYKLNQFNINVALCFSCDACIAICPENSLQYSREFENASNSLSQLKYHFSKEEVTKMKQSPRMRIYEVRK